MCSGVLCLLVFCLTTEDSRPCFCLLDRPDGDRDKSGAWPLEVRLWLGEKACVDCNHGALGCQTGMEDGREVPGGGDCTAQPWAVVAQQNTR